jgi:hypothetical protein
VKKKPVPRSTPVNEAGKAILRALRGIPIVRDKVVPWLVREEIDQLPSAPIAAAMRRELARLAKVPGPILVGPWLSEVGFELLYWVPFLKWAVAEFALDPSRLIAVSRGGVSSWYHGIADNYCDLFDLFSIDEYRGANEARWQSAGNQKQYDIGEYDKEIARLVGKRRGVTVEAMLHPSIMYRLLRFFWYEKAAVSLLQKHTRYDAIPKPPLPADRYGLPAHYTAVRFYFRPSFPDTPDNRAIVRDLVSRLQTERAVVLLNPGLRLDDHDDVEVGESVGPSVGQSKVYRIDHALTARDNLNVQTAVIAHADAFIGTYGGLSYLGPYLGVPTVGLYSHAPELVPAHLDVTWRLCHTMQSPLTVLSTADLALLSKVIAAPVGVSAATA